MFVLTSYILYSVNIALPTAHIGSFKKLAMAMFSFPV